MFLGSSVIANALLPLCIADTGTGIVAQAQLLQQHAADTYDNTRISVRSALHLDWQPQSLDPRSEGEIKCWQRSDASVRDSAVFTDDQGNIYMQAADSTLRVLKLKPGFSLEREAEADWMSSRIAAEAGSAGSLH
ncbi:MAG: hypothetical protein M3R04_03300 [bacterium]|nr:hypothetical protein [bacterium]